MNVQVPFWPWMKFAVWRLSSGTSGVPITVVGSTSLSFEVLRSPASDTTAALVTLGTAAAPTATVSAKLELSATRMAPACAGEMVGPACGRLHPAPAPLAYVVPVGRVSVRVVTPAVAA